MDRRTEEQFDSCFIAIVGGIFTLIGVVVFKLISLLFGTLIGAMTTSGEKNPEDELRKLKSTLYQRQRIDGTACPDCGTNNEEHKTQCYMCGASMVKRVEAVPPPSLAKQLAVVASIVVPGKETTVELRLLLKRQIRGTMSL